MTTLAYDNFFLSGFMKNLGFAVDFAVNGCGLTCNSFYDFFIASKVAEAIESRSPRFICGCSGTELALSVFERVGFEASTSQKKAYERYDRSPEYWAGWILAFYQWETNISFAKIRDYVPFSQIVNMYNPLHEAPKEKFLNVMNKAIREKNLKKSTNLHNLRKAAGLTQKELSQLAGVNLRTLQQYEIGSKDINKASGQAINSLALALHCNFYDVMELDLQEV